MIRRAPLAAALALALAGGAAAQEEEGPVRRDLFWRDPEFGEAVRAADAIVLAECTAVGEDGAVYRVDVALTGGGIEGKELRVLGLHHPSRRERPPVEVGDRAYLLLRGREEPFRLPTPTFGRFPVRSFGVIACIGDTFVRIPLPAPTFERFLACALGADPAPLLAKAREILGADQVDPTEAYVACRALALFGAGEGTTADDARLVMALLDRPAIAADRRYRVRMAAAEALGRLPTPPAGLRRLLTLAEEDPAAAVRSAAALALRPALEAYRDRPEYREATDRLAELALEADAEPIAFGTVDDPRTNELEGPLAAALRTLAALGSHAGVRPALRVLEREDEADALVAGLAYFQALGDPEQAGAIAFRMRRPDAEDAVLNRLFASTLRALTGEDLGEDREAWVAWWRERTLERGEGPIGPPPPDDDEGPR